MAKIESIRIWLNVNKSDIHTQTARIINIYYAHYIYHANYSVEEISMKFTKNMQHLIHDHDSSNIF